MTPTIDRTASYIARLVAAITASLFFSVSAATAATITVDTDADDTLAALDNDGTCSLREAIQNANTDAAGYVDCDAGSGADTIKFNGVSSITLKDSISVITDVLVQGTVAISGAGKTRLFTVSSSSAAPCA
jgi:CSLREA domain-containing protein